MIKPYTIDQVRDDEERLVMNVSKLHGYLEESVRQWDTSGNRMSLDEMIEVVRFLDKILEVGQ